MQGQKEENKQIVWVFLFRCILAFSLLAGFECSKQCVITQGMTGAQGISRMLLTDFYKLSISLCLQSLEIIQ